MAYFAVDPLAGSSNSKSLNRSDRRPSQPWHPPLSGSPAQMAAGEHLGLGGLYTLESGDPFLGGAPCPGLAVSSLHGLCDKASPSSPTDLDGMAKLNAATGSSNGDAPQVFDEMLLRTQPGVTLSDSSRKAHGRPNEAVTTNTSSLAAGSSYNAHFPPIGDKAGTATTRKDRPVGAVAWNLFLKENHPATQSDLKLSYICPDIIDGKKVVVCPDDEIAENTKDWNSTIIGFVMEKRPYYVHLKNVMEKLWKPRGSLEVFTRDNGMFMFKFTLEKDCQRVLQEGPWFFEGKMMMLRRWEKGTAGDRTYLLKSLPIWARLPNLPVEWWSPTTLSRAASTTGKPMFMDIPTGRKERLNYARLCVEIDVNDPLPETVTFCSKDGKTKHVQKVKYDGIPRKCAACKTFGHSEGQCSSRKLPPRTQLAHHRATVNKPPPKPVTKQNWRVKNNAIPEGFEAASAPKSLSLPPVLTTTDAVKTSNHFSILSGLSEADVPASSVAQVDTLEHCVPAETPVILPSKPAVIIATHAAGLSVKPSAPPTHPAPSHSCVISAPSSPRVKPTRPISMSLSKIQNH